MGSVTWNFASDAQRRWYFAVMAKEQAKALASYKEFAFASVNRMLREGSTGLGPGADKDTSETIRHIDEVMRVSQTPRDLVLFRGQQVPQAMLDKPEAMIGREVPIASFLSTSTDESLVATRYMGKDRSVGFRIRAPKGIHAVDMDGFGGGVAESEVLLNRGQKVRIVRVYRKHGKVWFDAELVSGKS
jgi:hypothetical protein